MATNKILEFLDPFWKDTINRIAENLERADRFGRNRVASGVTKQRIGAFNETPVTIISTDKYKVQIGMPEYYAFIDEGVQGADNFSDNRRRSTGRFKFTNKMPPLAPIRQFMLNRGIVGDRGRFNKAKNKDEYLNSLAFVIARGIYRRGIEQTNFYSDVVNDDLIKRFEEGLSDAFQQEIFTIIDLRTK